MPGHTPIIPESQTPSSRRGSRSTEISRGSDRSGSVASSTTSLSQLPHHHSRKPRRQEKVHLQEVEQTLLITLFWRSLDAQSARPILGCRRAGEALARLEDVGWLAGSYGADPRWVSYVAGRAARIDAWTAEFLAAWPGRRVTVLHLACGLDSRDRRVARDPELVRWIDVERPLVSNLRERVMSGAGGGGDGVDDGGEEEEGEGEGEEQTSLRPVGDYSLRTLNVAEGRWYCDIPADRPTLVVAEGLFPYLSPAEAEGVIRGLTDYFGQGQLVFDTVGSMAVAHTRRINILKPSGSRLQWGVDDARDVLGFHGKLRLRDQVRWFEFMGVEGEISRETAPPWFGPKAMAVARYTSSFKDNGQVLRFDF